MRVALESIAAVSYHTVVVSPPLLTFILTILTTTLLKTLIAMSLLVATSLQKWK